MPYWGAGASHAAQRAATLVHSSVPSVLRNAPPSLCCLDAFGAIIARAFSISSPNFQHRMGDDFAIALEDDRLITPPSLEPRRSLSPRAVISDGRVVAHLQHRSVWGHILQCQSEGSS